MSGAKPGDPPSLSALPASSPTPTPVTVHAPSDVELSEASSSDESSPRESADPAGNSIGHDISRRTPVPRNTDNARRPTNVRVLDDPVYVEGPAEEHSSWSAWMSYLKDYSRRTNQIIRVSLSLSCKIRNDRLSKTKAAAESDLVPYVPVEWGVYQRTYICTHGWSTKDRGTGKRPKQFVRGTGCPFRFVVQLVEDADGQWSLRVKNGSFMHNHAVGSKQFSTYAENRKVDDCETKANVNQMMKHGRKRGQIYDYLLARGENLVLSDVANLVSQFKSDGRGDVDDDEAVARALTEFAAEDGNVVTVDENEHGHSGVVNMTSRHQQDMLTRFPELLLVDCTHKTNRYNYQLCTFMAIDENGKGQPVQHSLLERNADWHMSRALDHLFRVDPKIGDKVQVLMVDKDLNEIRVLKTYFPNARVLICLFHVLKYLKMASRKPEYGTLSPEDHEAIDMFVYQMVYANSEEVYSKNLASMRKLCDDTGFTSFLEYFEENWVKCSDMWVMWERARLAHMRVHTNNHLESWFGKLKLCVAHTMSMLETVQAIVAADARTANEYMYNKSRVGSRVHRGYDEELEQVLRFTTHFVASHVEKEYISAMAKVDEFDFNTESTPGSVVVKGKHKTHVVDVTTWKCTCSFSCAMRLPCQHAIAFRKWSHAAGCVIPLGGIDERWLHVVQQPTKPRPIVVNEFVKGRTKRKTLDSANKFKMAISATQQLCSELADISDDDEFHEYLDFVVDSWNNVRQRKRVKMGPQVAPVSTGRPLLSRLASTDGQASLVSTPTMPRTLDDAQDVDVEEKTDAKSPEVDECRQKEKGQVAGEINSSDDISIKLNPKAAKTGRPRSNRKEKEAEEKRKRAVFNESAEHRRKIGDITLVQLASSLQVELPSLQKTLNRVAIPVKFEKAMNKRPKLVVQRYPVLNESAFYLLPYKLLLKCKGVLPTRNTPETAISVFSQSQPTGDKTQQVSKHGGNTDSNGGNTDSNGDTAEVECVEISGIGKFSRAQIESMLYLANLKTQCEEGLDFCSWLETTAISSVQTGQHEALRDMIERVKQSNPETPISVQGVSYYTAMVFRLKPPAWADSALISAFCGRLCETFQTARLIGTQKALTGKKTLTMDEDLKKHARELVTEANVLMIPVNFGNTHWCAIWVEVKQHRVLFYDSMNQKTYKTVLDRLAWDLAKTLSDEFEVLSVNNPIQTDGHNCGFYVMLKLWRAVDKNVVQDTTPTGLTLLRFHILQFVLTGSTN